METLDPSGLQHYACLRCQTRKVKCDRLNPRCSKCVKSNVQCEYKAPAPPNRGKRKRVEAELQAKLQHYETLLKDRGVCLEQHAPNDPHSSKASPATPAQTQAESSPQHVILDNPVLMTGEPHTTKAFIKDPLPHMGNALWQDLTELKEKDDTSSEDEEDGPDVPKTIDDGSEMVLGMNCEQVPLQIPRHRECLRLWQTYMENFHPLTNIVHSPTVEAHLNQSLEAPQHITVASMALFTAIFGAAVVTLTNEQCESYYAESKESMLDRYRKATKLALIRSYLISTTDMDVLLAFVIFIVSAQHDYAHEALWTLVGVAVRIGQRLGLHRTEHLPDLSIFKAEMRRRLWWQICILNSQLGEVTGQTGQRTTLPAEPLLDVAMPANLSDRDLHPEIQTLVPQREGATQMMFCRIRFEFGVYIRNGYLKKLFVPNTVTPEAMRQTLAEKDKAVDELERIFENKYLRYADPLVPVQLLATIMARAIITRLRLMSHHPRQYIDKGASMPESEKELVTLLSLKTLEYDGLDAPSLRGFEWHHRNQVHWLALVDVLSELRKCPSGSDPERAWKLVEKIYNTHPEVLRRRKRPLFRALNSMALSAWTKHAADYEQRYSSKLQTPGFIAAIQESRQRKKEQRASLNHILPPDTYVSGDRSVEQTGITPYSNDDIIHMTDDLGSFNPADMDATLFNPIDWDQWDDLIRDWETQTSQNLFS